MQNSLKEFIGLTPDGRAIYSNSEDISLTPDGSKLVDRLGRTMIDFETQDQVTTVKPINPKYSSPAFLVITRTAHDLVEYSQNFRYAKVLWLDDVSVRSTNSEVSVKVEIIEIDTEDEQGISISLIGALEDISQFDITKKDARVSIIPKKSWGYFASKRTCDNSKFSRFHRIVGKISADKLVKRKVTLTIKVSKGTEQYLWSEQGYRK